MKYLKNVLPSITILTLVMFAMPNFALAADPDCSAVEDKVENINELFTLALCTLDDTVIPFLVGIGLVIFLAGVVKFVGAGDNEEKRQGGRDMMIFGLIALFVMVSAWGFVNIISQSIFGENAEIQSLPSKSTTIFKSE